jgi:aspartyl-tRNA(Asn)/glutamyl-tRNA(Gln) amidotransferase subunit B
VFAGVNDGNLEEGSLRCDANVSIRPIGQTTFGTRVELKNLNSFRFVQRAIDTEVARQTAIIDAGGEIEQETRQYDPDRNITKSLRSKANAHDYRYFPDPDLPPLVLDETLIEAERKAIGELPVVRRARYLSMGVSDGAAATLTGHPRIAAFFDAVVELFPHPQKASNWVVTEVLRGTKTHGLDAHFPVTPQQVAELLQLVDAGDISGKQAKDVYLELEGTNKTPLAIVEAKGMRVVSDDGALRPVCEKVLADNPAAVETYRAGKTGTLGFFVGQVMKLTKGSANPKLVNDLIVQLLNAPTK